ncbi:MAG: T9SS type A sorting domain-containing protein, partial [Chitinophagaceae bacterium]|nr:T9SS type A sorting domain-containing protein [Chitinophagaceae bacterium]
TMDMDTFLVDTSTVYNKTSSLLPLFSNGDESDWVTHQVDLTSLKHIVPLYVGFRYTSANGTSGSTWFLDNINTTTAFLAAPDNNHLFASAKKPFTSWYSNDAVNITCNLTNTGTYTLLLTDMTGRLIVRSELLLTSGKQHKSIPVGNLSSGIYLLSIRGENEAFTARLPVQQ